MAFNWSCTVSSSGAVLPLPGASSLRSALELRGGPPLQAGVTHALRVVGCLQSSPDLCSTAEVSVTLRDSPLVARLAGGNRAVGVDDGLQLDASASADPDEPAARLNYAWSCSPADTDSRCPPLPDASAVPLLALLPGALPPRAPLTWALVCPRPTARSRRPALPSPWSPEPCPPLACGLQWRPSTMPTRHSG